MDALYAFMRVSDDLADEPGEVADKRRRLHDWRDGLLRAISGRCSHPIHPALVDLLDRYQVPTRLLLDVLDGVESDLEPIRFANFAELYPYCYRVASAVGLACVQVWGSRPGADAGQIHAMAEATGIALQLTNILRDLGEDLHRGRVYLPADELVRFGCVLDVAAGESRAFRDLMSFQIARAREYYHRAEPLCHLLSDDGRPIFQVMVGMYRSLLDAVEDDVGGVLVRRIRVPRWRKGWILLGGWLSKCGWV
jgi:phytoene synthase